MSWFDAATAATYTASTAREVVKAARMHEKFTGSLHGYQRVAPSGKWRFEQACLDAWVRGEVCDHRSNVRQIRAAAS